MEPLPPQIPYEELHKRLMEEDGYIEKKYKEIKSPDQGRTDALNFAKTLVACTKEEAVFYNFTPEERKQLQINQWEEAIEQAEEDNWLLLKQIIQDDARNSMESAVNRQKLIDQFPGMPGKPMIEEDRARSFFNLANSLGI